MEATIMKQQPLLEVRNLRTYFYTRKGIVKAVDGVDFTVNRGEVLGIVGESGSGKSIASLSILRLLSTNAKIEPGSLILLDGKNLAELPNREMCRVRGTDIAMIFQDPMTSLNPVMTIGKQLAEAATAHQHLSGADARTKALDMLRRVEIPSPEARLKEYPHQLSGGMKQRVMIAMALIRKPRLLIADEPTTALDVTIQAQILELMRRLREETGTAIILITHDMGVVASIADRILVMYAGQIQEAAATMELFASPMHPYTKGLLQSIPRLDRKDERLFTIEGAVLDQYNLPEGCRFAPRCPYARAKCQRLAPPLYQKGTRQIKCWLYEKESEKP